MIRTFRSRVILFALFSIVGSATVPLSYAAQPLDTAKIEQLTGAKGKMDEKEGAFKVSLPRSDINVTAGGGEENTPPGATTPGAFLKKGRPTLGMRRPGVVGEKCDSSVKRDPV